MKIDVHQHLWSEQLVAALARRRELPFVRRENGLTVLYLAYERPYVIDLEDESPARRAALVRSDGLSRALLCLSSPLGIEQLERRQACALIDAYLDGALALGEPFGVWAAVALDGPDPDDVDRALDRGCVGVSLPAGALAGARALAHVRPLLARLQDLNAPLFVHPGPAHAAAASATATDGGLSLVDPIWWPALTSYVASMQAAWLAFTTIGRVRQPRLRVVFAMLAGLAPLHAERLLARGGPRPRAHDPLTFYDTSSYGPIALAAMRPLVASDQLLYGSDRPVLDPREGSPPALADVLDWQATSEATARALGPAHALDAGHARGAPRTAVAP